MINIYYSKKQFNLVDDKNIALGYITNNDLSGVEYIPLNYYSYNIENSLLVLLTDKSYYNHIISIQDGYNNYYYLIDYVYKQDEKIICNSGKIIIKSHNRKIEEEYLITVDTLDPFQNNDNIENCSYDCFVEEVEEDSNNDVIYLGEYITQDNPNSGFYIQSQKYNTNLFSTIALSPNKQANKTTYELTDNNGLAIFSHTFYKKNEPRGIQYGETYDIYITEWLSIDNDRVTQYYILPGMLDLSILKLVSYEKRFEINNVPNLKGVNKIRIFIKTYFYITTPRTTHILEYNYNSLFTDIYNNTMFITKPTKLYFDMYKGVIIFVNDKYQKIIETMQTTIFLAKSNIENFIDKNGQTIGSALGLIGSTASLVSGIVSANPMPVISGISGIANSSVNIAKNVMNSEHYKDYAYKINAGAGLGYLNAKMYKNYSIQCYTKTNHRQNNYYLVKKRDSIIPIWEDLTILVPKGMYKIIKFKR